MCIKEHNAHFEECGHNGHAIKPCGFAPVVPDPDQAALRCTSGIQDEDSEELFEAPGKCLLCRRNEEHLAVRLTTARILIEGEVRDMELDEERTSWTGTGPQASGSGASGSTSVKNNRGAHGNSQQNRSVPTSGTHSGRGRGNVSRGGRGRGGAGRGSGGSNNTSITGTSGGAGAGNPSSRLPSNSVHQPERSGESSGTNTHHHTYPSGSGGSSNCGSGHMSSH